MPEAGMKEYETVIYLTSGTWTKPRYARVEYTMVSGHFYVRVRYKNGHLETSTRNRYAVRFERNFRDTDALLLEWLKGKTAVPVDEEEAKRVDPWP